MIVEALLLLLPTLLLWAAASRCAAHTAAAIAVGPTGAAASNANAQSGSSAKRVSAGMRDQRLHMHRHVGPLPPLPVLGAPASLPFPLSCFPHIAQRLGLYNAFAWG